MRLAKIFYIISEEQSQGLRHPLSFLYPQDMKILLQNDAGFLKWKSSQIAISHYYLLSSGACMLKYCLSSKPVLDGL